jgi:hypothetical protein
MGDGHVERVVAAGPLRDAGSDERGVVALKAAECLVV